MQWLVTEHPGGKRKRGLSRDISRRFRGETDSLTTTIEWKIQSWKAFGWTCDVLINLTLRELTRRTNDAPNNWSGPKDLGVRADKAEGTRQSKPLSVTGHLSYPLFCKGSHMSLEHEQQPERESVVQQSNLRNIGEHPSLNCKLSGACDYRANNLWSSDIVELGEKEGDLLGWRTLFSGVSSCNLHNFNFFKFVAW